jgi:hypothetical protein
VHHGFGGDLKSQCDKQNIQKKECVTLCGLAIIYIKKYLKAKEEELWKLKYFTMQKSSRKTPLKET